jgi:predicted HicB family RNase H-like nuclease
MNTKKKKNNSICLRMPLTIHRQVEKLANDDGISINQFISLSLVEKIARLEQSSQAPLTIPIRRADKVMAI